MSTLDKMADMFSEFSSGGGATTQIMSSLTNQPGGLSSLLSKLREAGLGEIVQSWVGTGENRPVSGNQIQTAFGGDMISKLASSAGVTNNSAASLIARYLPLLVDKLTPNGQVPTSGLQGAQVIGALTSLFNMESKSDSGKREMESPYRDGLPQA